MGEKNLNKVLENCHYPSSIDNMQRNDTPSEGTATSMPAMSPIGNGKIPVTTVKKPS